MKLPPALALMLLLFALTFLAGLIVLALMPKSTTFQGLGRFLSGLYEMICASRGTQIDVDASDRRIALTLH